MMAQLWKPRLNTVLLTIALWTVCIIAGWSQTVFREGGIPRMVIATTGNVGIGTTSPSITALLELSSTSAGILIPRLTQAERDAINSPALWLLIFNTTAQQFEYWNGSQWIPLISATSLTSSSWSLTGNAGTNPATNFLGTTDNQPLIIKVNNTQALRIEPTSGTVNIIGGTVNTVSAGVSGAVIGGGGTGGSANQVTDSFGTIGGGMANQAGNSNTDPADAGGATVGGGMLNIASGQTSTVSGGALNTASGESSIVGGGIQNTASGRYSTVGGGSGNTASGDNSTVSGGGNNTASGYFSAIGGGGNNLASGFSSTIGGGSFNVVSGQYGTIGGGDQNVASGGWSTVSGGQRNTAGGDYSWAGGSSMYLSASADRSFVWGYAAATTAITASDAFLIGPYGNSYRVGINVLNPAAALHVNVGSWSYPLRVEGLPTTSASSTVLVSDAAGIVYTTSASALAASNAWSLTGNAGTDPTTNFLGTIDNRPLVIRTNNTEVMRVTTTGNVGVGTVTPTVKLHVKAVSNPLRLEGLQPLSNASTILAVDGSGVVYTTSASSLASASAWNITGNSGTDPATNFLGTTDNQPLVIRTNNVERMRITVNGYVGIGTDTPGEMLDIVGNSDADLDLTSFGSSISTIHMRRALGSKSSPAPVTNNNNLGGVEGLGYDGTQYVRAAGIDFQVDGPVTANVVPGRIVFRVRRQGSTSWGGEEQVFIKNDGKVGIRVAHPTHRLHVVAETGEDPLRLEGLRTTTATVDLLVATASGSVHTSNVQSLVGTVAWLLTGNAGTDPATNFLGTTDNQPLIIKVNNTQALRIDPNSVSPNIIGGYSGNSIASSVVGAIISGGGKTAGSNQVTDNYGVVGGGAGNRAGNNSGTTSDASYATVGGGYVNIASGQYSMVGGGQSNVASGNHTVVAGGYNNHAIGSYTAVGGGINNSANGNYGIVSGGELNNASGSYSTIGGGKSNIASGQYSVIGGGINNVASNTYSTVGGGSGNQASSWASTVGGGQGNTAGGNGGTISGGENNTINAVLGTIGGGQGNTVSGDRGTIAGGQNNAVNGIAGTIGGGQGNTAGGNGSTIAGGQSNTASGSYSSIGGGINNSANGNNSTVGGGELNSASGSYSTVGGGKSNAAGGSYSTIGGGINNAAENNYSAVVGGQNNKARGWYSTIGGGGDNSVSGRYSTISGGRGNTVAGDYGWAGGRGMYAVSSADRTFVWGYATATTAITVSDAFLIGPYGNSYRVGINVLNPTAALHVAAGSWTYPLRIEGLPTTSASSTVLVSDAGGIIYATGASSLVGSNVWLLTGNAGTNPASNFLGTTDNQPLSIRSNNQEVVRISTSGVQMLHHNTTSVLSIGPNQRVKIQEYQPHSGTDIGAPVWGRGRISVGGTVITGFWPAVKFNTYWNPAVSQNVHITTGSAFVINHEQDPAANNLVIYYSPYQSAGQQFQYNVGLALTTSGNVGIGTDAPTAKLHISAVSAPLRLEGLQATSATTTLLAADGQGVVYATNASSLINNQAWSLLGNSGTDPAVNFVGTIDAQPLVFRTGNVERARITTAGHLGIGTSNPGWLLDVAGSVHFGTSGNFGTIIADMQAANSYAGGLQVRKRGATGDANAAVVDGSEIGYHDFWGWDGNNYKRLAYVLVTAHGNITPGSGGGDYAIVTRDPTTNTEETRLFIDARGYVGIGTTTPLRRLVVGNDDINGISLEEGTSPNAGYLRFGDNTGWKFHIGRSRESTSGPLNTGTAGVLVTIQDNGNVGIGTTAPARTLVIEDDAAGTNLVTLQNTNNGGYTSIDFLDNGGTLIMSLGAANTGVAGPYSGDAYIHSHYGADLYLGVSSSTGDIIFSTNNYTERMRITADGNVGIGNSAPPAALTITNAMELRGSGNVSSVESDIFFTYSGGIAAQNALYFFIDADNDNTNTAFHFRRNGETISGTNSEELMVIRENGKVGIGVSNPSNILTIVQNSSTDPIADAWTTYSTPETKIVLGKLDADALQQYLRQFKQLPVYRWQRTESEPIRVSAMAEPGTPSEIMAYDEKGEIQGIDLQGYIGFLHTVVKAQQQILEQQQATIQQLQTSTQRQQTEIHQLRQQLATLQQVLEQDRKRQAEVTALRQVVLQLQQQIEQLQQQLKVTQSQQ